MRLVPRECELGGGICGHSGCETDSYPSCAFYSRAYTCSLAGACQNYSADPRHPPGDAGPEERTQNT